MFKEGIFEGKVILITGGGTGLGRAMGEYLGQLGAKLIITSRDIERNVKVAKEMEEITGNTVLPLQCDVRNYDEVEKVIAEGYEKLGSIDMLINNAAGNFISPTERLSHNAFSAIIDIVLKGTANFTLCLGKKWIADKKHDVKRNILNIATTYAESGSGYVVPSACAKAGVVAMTKSLAVEWAKYGIRLNAIAPGPFPSKGAWERLLPGELAEKFDLSKRNPMKRVGDKKELAALVAFLFSPMAEYINGEVITIDGAEQLKGAGQFNILDMLPQEQWDMIEQLTRKAKS